MAVTVNYLVIAGGGGGGYGDNGSTQRGGAEGRHRDRTGAAHGYFYGTDDHAAREHSRRWWLPRKHTIYLGR